MKILIGSIGRRNYLVDWFSAALRTEALDGEIVTTDASSASAGSAAGHRFVLAPRYADRSYLDFMVNLFRHESPDIFISVNDYEIDTLASASDSWSESLGGLNQIPDGRTQRILSDKLLYAEFLTELSVPTLVTSEYAQEALALNRDAEWFISKDRFGSGSSGLHRYSRQELEVALRASGASNALLDGQRVFQPLATGPEYGVDAIYSFDQPGQLLGVLARRKIRMRSGETDQAITVDAAPYWPSLAKLGAALGLRGTVDCDFLTGTDGEPLLIDTNPRFGGGYPFSHVAGADVPRHFVRTALGRPYMPSLLEARLGVRSAKYESVAVTSEPRTASHDSTLA